MLTLSEEQNQSCEGEISFEESASKTTNHLANDGLPIEFYKTCWNLISKSFIEWGDVQLTKKGSRHFN